MKSAAETRSDKAKIVYSFKCEISVILGIENR